MERSITWHVSSNLIWSQIGEWSTRSIRARLTALEWERSAHTRPARPQRRSSPVHVMDRRRSLYSTPKIGTPNCRSFSIPIGERTRKNIKGSESPSWPAFNLLPHWLLFWDLIWFFSGRPERDRAIACLFVFREIFVSCPCVRRRSDCGFSRGFATTIVFSPSPSSSSTSK